MSENSDDPPPADPITATRACPMLGITASTLRKWARQKRLRQWRVEGRKGYFYSLAEVDGLRAKFVRTA